MEILSQFDTIYKKTTKHRKQCRECGKLIQDGATVQMRKIKTEKYYPVKGLMKFVKWHFRHAECV